MIALSSDRLYINPIYPWRSGLPTRMCIPRWKNVSLIAVKNLQDIAQSNILDNSLLSIIHRFMIHYRFPIDLIADEYARKCG
jgi:hypothetical protein